MAASGRKRAVKTSTPWAADSSRAAVPRNHGASPPAIATTTGPGSCGPLPAQRPRRCVSRQWRRRPSTQARLDGQATGP